MIRMPATPTASAVRSGLVAECLSVPAPGTAGEAGAMAAGGAGAMVPVLTDAEVMDAEAMPTAALPEEAEVASMAANPAAAVSTVAEVAEVTVAEVTVAEATVAEVTVADPTVADTGKNSRQREVSTAGSTALPAIFSLVDGPAADGQPPHSDFHFSPRP